MPPRRRRHGLELGLILLLNELLQFGMRNIPPVTLCTIFGQTLLYMGFINVPWDKEEVCISAQAVIREKDWKRLILSAFEHGDDMHLYYNMASFLIKGRSLERRYGSKNFSFILFFLICLTGVMYVFLAQLMTEIMETQKYMNSCAIGFSGVIFALKVLTTHEEPFIKAMLVGVQIPGKYAAWIELIVIHMLVPNSSFMGHLAGILAGIIYCKTIIGTVADKIFYCLTGVRYSVGFTIFRYDPKGYLLLRSTAIVAVGITGFCFGPEITLHQFRSYFVHLTDHITLRSGTILAIAVWLAGSRCHLSSIK